MTTQHQTSIPSCTSGCIPKHLDPLFIVQMCQRAVMRQTPFGMLPYSYGYRILHDVIEYLDGSNPAEYGKTSWLAQWWAHYDAQKIIRNVAV